MNPQNKKNRMITFIYKIPEPIKMPQSILTAEYLSKQGKRKTMKGHKYVTFSHNCKEAVALLNVLRNNAQIIVDNHVVKDYRELRDILTCKKAPALCEYSCISKYISALNCLITKRATSFIISQLRQIIEIPIEDTDGYGEYFILNKEKILSMFLQESSLVQSLCPRFKLPEVYKQALLLDDREVKVVYVRFMSEKNKDNHPLLKELYDKIEISEDLKSMGMEIKDIGHDSGHTPQLTFNITLSKPLDIPLNYMAILYDKEDKIIDTRSFHRLSFEEEQKEIPYWELEQLSFINKIVFYKQGEIKF